ncbi:Transmembrane protein 65 [Anabarilius grahami]|uniref:Transmembrane protein 65 n=1 Tax=Anabarilius grahami TaxID=495550 RepID=A0A3N0Y004_ANAGA|nr:Transmembrane protein 65 [Anabarilius grahami]
MIRLASVRALLTRRAPGPGQLHRCFLGTHRRKIKPEQLDLPNQAREFVYGLSPATRICLLKELQNFESKAEVLLHNAIPFVGFGFLDNAIMIAAVSPSVNHPSFITDRSTAALGNLVSDLAGLGLAGYVEALAARFGMQIPDLTPRQGKAIGIAIGCILGMFPLLFLSDDEEDEKKKKSHPSSD